jgi:hypothetical protein
MAQTVRSSDRANPLPNAFRRGLTAQARNSIPMNSAGEKNPAVTWDDRTTRVE